MGAGFSRPAARLKARLSGYTHSRLRVQEKTSVSVPRENGVPRAAGERSGRLGPCPIPAVPMVVVVAAKYLAVPLMVPFDLQRHFQADLRYRLRSSHRMGPGLSSWHPGGGEQHDSHHSSRGSGSHRFGRPAGAGSLALIAVPGACSRAAAIFRLKPEATGIRCPMLRASVPPWSVGVAVSQRGLCVSVSLWFVRGGCRGDPD